MPRISRRKLLQYTAGATAVTSGGLAAILASGRAPAYAQGTQIHWLKWNDYVPAADVLLRDKMLGEAEKALGFKIKLETIGLNDLQARATAAIQAQSGADIIMAFNNNAQLYAESTVDVSDVFQTAGADPGVTLSGRNVT